jgi:D-alanyl-D-alanine carboxypeptidase
MLSSPRWRLIAALVVLIALGVAACSSDGEETAEGTAATSTTAAVSQSSTATTEAVEPETTTTTEPETPIDPLVGLRDDLTDILTTWQDENGAPAVSLSVRLPGTEPINIASGVTDLVTEEPVTTDDYFRVASITKPMTAAVVLQLVDEGLIELDAPVRTYLPGWLEGYPYADDITIRQLMDHTNGLIEYAFDPGFYALMGPRLDQPIEPQELFAFLASTDPLFEPGEQYSYETGGFYTLGAVIEEVTGNSAAAEMRARIFEPAGADHIFLTPEEFPPEQVVNGYGRTLVYLAGTVIIGRTDEVGLMINDEPVVGMLDLPQEVLSSAGWTGGGNESRLESVSAIFKAMFDGTILSNGLIEQMTAPVLDVNYGLGISVDDLDGVTVYSHGGGVPGFRSQAGYLPDHDISYAVSSTLIPLPEGADVGELQRQIVPALVAASDQSVSAG